jgi:hypothetical protein
MSLCFSLLQPSFLCHKVKKQKLTIKLKNNSPKSNRNDTVGSRFEIVSLISLVNFLLDLIQFYHKIKMTPTTVGHGGWA